MKAEKGNGGFFVQALKESEQPGFLTSPLLVRLLGSRPLGGAIWSLSGLASLSYPARWRRGNVTDVGLSSYDLVDKRYGILHTERLAESGVKPAGLYVLPSGAIAFGRIRPYLANIGVVPDTKFGHVVTNSEWIVIEHRKGFNFLLCAVLRSPYCLRQVFATSGQTRPRISLEALAELKLPWPFDNRESVRLETELRGAFSDRVHIDGRLAELNIDIVERLNSSSRKASQQ